jgi:hypothetical protein
MQRSGAGVRALARRRGVSPTTVQNLCVGIDRTSKFAFARLHEKADRPTAVAFLEALLEAVPYGLHTILSDDPVLSDGRQAGSRRRRPVRRPAGKPGRLDRSPARPPLRPDLPRARHRPPADQAEPAVDQRAEPAPAQAGVERMNRTIKDATVKRHQASHDKPREHLRLFIDAYNHGRRLKTLPQASRPANSSPPSGQKNRVDPNSTHTTTQQD